MFWKGLENQINKTKISENVEIQYRNYKQIKRENNAIIEVNIEELQQEAKEGSVIILKDGKYAIDKEEEMKIRKIIEDKMNKLWI